MPLPNYYAIGTVSVASGSTAVTGTGTAFLSVGIKAGDKLGKPSAGFAGIRITADADDNGALTLATPWPYTSLVDSDYEIEIIPEGVSLATSVRQMLQALTNGDLSTIAAVSVDAADGSILQRVGGAWAVATTASLLALAGDGTLGAPGMAFAAQPATGFYRSASNQIDAVANSATMVRFADGQLEIRKAGSSSNEILLQHDGTSGYIRTQAGTLFVGAGAASHASISAAGVVTILTNRLTLQGDISSAAWTTGGIAIKQASATYTDTSTATGTLAANVVNAIGVPTMAFTNTVTVTDAYNAYFWKPVAGANATLTNSWAIGAESIKCAGLVNTATLAVSSTATIATSLAIGGATIGSNALAVNGALNVAYNQNGDSFHALLNSSSGTAARTGLQLDNGTSSSFLYQTGNSYTTTGIFRQNGAVLVANGVGGLTLNTGTAAAIYLAINSSEVGRIDTDGCLNMGSTGGAGYHILSRNVADYAARIRNLNASPYCLSLLFSNAAPNNTTNSFISASDTSQQRFVVHSNGNVQNANNSYGAISDRKLKQEISLAGSQWEDIKALAALTSKYRMKSDPAGPFHLGLIAQDVLNVSPGLVIDIPDMDEKHVPAGTSTKAIAYSILYMKAVKALGEALERIEALEGRLT